MASAFSDPLAPSPCEQCGNANEGTMRCSVRDSKNLCQDCFEGLPHARREDIGDPEWVCNIHLNHKVDIFCETCQLGCCKECAVDVHKGHKVVDVFQHVEEIRRDLTEQLQEVGAGAERLAELRRTRKIESSLEQIEEAPKLLEEVVDEIKKEIAQNLEKEILRLQWKIKRVKEQADLDFQRIQEIQRGISTGLLEDAEKRIYKLQKAESKLLDGQQACESANVDINCLLESTPKKLVCRGRRLCSLTKAISTSQCHNDVIESCREVEADLPKLRVEKANFCYGFRPCSPIVTTVLCISVLFFFANIARGSYRDEYNRMLSSELMTSMNILLRYVASFDAVKYLMLTFLLTGSTSDYPITREVSFMQERKHFTKIVHLGLKVWLLTVLVHILVSSLFYIFLVKSASANILSIISILQSCFFWYGMRNSKTFKDFCDYQMLYKF